MINAQASPENNSQLLRSVLRQRYQNYKIFINDEKGEYGDDSSEELDDEIEKKMKTKVKVINEEIDHMKEC